jgi:predicted esterase
MKINGVAHESHDEYLVLKQSSIPVDIPAHVLLTSDASSDEFILLIHGFGQTAKIFSERISEFLGDRPICAVQAPFPVLTSGRQIGYSWYAFDRETNTFQIPIATGVDFLRKTLEHFRVADRIRKVIGYSQGGYMAPFIGLRLPHVKQVIGINCRFKDEDLSGSKISFRIDAIHGANDAIVEPEKARASHQKLIEMGCTGTFTVLPDTAHELSEPIGRAVTKALSLE